MITLNGVTLNDGLVWTNEFDYLASSQLIVYTLLGNAVIQTMPMNTRQEIKLVATSEGSSFIGSFTREQIQAFKLLEKEGNTVIFHYEGVDYNVVVKSGGVQMSPILSGTNQNTSDLYTGTLLLVEV